MCAAFNLPYWRQSSSARVNWYLSCTSSWAGSALRISRGLQTRVNERTKIIADGEENVYGQLCGIIFAK